jgi:hypothetical protein
MRRLAVPAAVMFAVAGVALADEIKSGLEVGASAPAYNSLDVTGEDKGRKLCLR